MKKILSMFIVIVMCFAFVGCGSGEDANTDEPKGSAKTETTYGIGDTWEVEGQWKLTIDGVTITDERNEYADEEPAQVVIIDYSYENIGYEDEDGIMDGLYFAIDNEQIVDSAGEMGYSYPIDAKYPDEVPVGARCSAQAAIGFNNAGNSFTLYINTYDGHGNEQKATFKIEY